MIESPLVQQTIKKKSTYKMDDPISTDKKNLKTGKGKKINAVTDLFETPKANSQKEDRRDLKNHKNYRKFN